MAVRRNSCPYLLAGAAVLAAVAFPARGKEVTLSVADLQAPGFAAHGMRARLSGASLREFSLQIERVVVAGRTFQKAQLTCPELEVGPRISCRRGTFYAGDKIPVEFSYSAASGELHLELKPAPDEAWRMSGRIAGADSALDVKIDKGRPDRFTSWLPAGAPKINAGTVSGTVALRGGVATMKVDVQGLTFADASGLHAGEKIAATVDAQARSKGGDWIWSARLGWGAGEVFWQPVFAAASGQRLQVEGTTAGGVTDLRHGRLELPGIGTAEFSGQWNHAKALLARLEARATRLRLGPLYDQLLKTLLQATALGDLRAEGEATLAVRLSGAEFTAIDAEFSGVSFEDRQRRFALFGAAGKLGWRRDEWSGGEITFKGAELLKVAIGAATVPLRLRGSSVAIDSVRVPVLDGALLLKDFRAGATDAGWRWSFSGELMPVSMVEFSRAAGLPLMHGSLAGVIPEVRYRRGTLAMDGALLIRAFDGTVSASNVQLIAPFGPAPRLHADVEMKNLDLDLLTRAFDFGTMTGRIDARVGGLELVGWEPVRFDARIQSSPGTYPRKISQRAVQNISALGGAGAAAAIQRSFLRFFEQFGYDRLGLSCRLENGVCEMDGIERAPQGYVIVKGGGVPAISVIGYNRHVSWRELVERLKRITQDNVKPIVK